MDLTAKTKQRETTLSRRETITVYQLAAKHYGDAGIKQQLNIIYTWHLAWYSY